MFKKKKKTDELKLHPEVSVYGKREWKDNLKDFFDPFLNLFKRK